MNLAIDDKIQTQCQRHIMQAPSELCRNVAKMFGAQEHEVALLRVDGHFLRFVYPLPLSRVGLIPLSHASCVAVRTVVHRKAEMFNNFAAVRHVSVFEAVPLGADRPEQIHRLMSVPVICDGEVTAVLQVCRKASNPGREFVPDDLRNLVSAVRSVHLAFGDV